MKARCLNPQAQAFDRYGLRGIKVCQEWAESFEAFFRDMGPRPPGLTLDRIDNNGNYCPENCEWRSRVAQSNNTRRTKRYAVNGKEMTIREGCDLYGLPYNTVEARLRLGWSVERAFQTPKMR